MCMRVRNVCMYVSTLCAFAPTLCFYVCNVRMYGRFGCRYFMYVLCVRVYVMFFVYVRYACVCMCVYNVMLVRSVPYERYVACVRMCVTLCALAVLCRVTCVRVLCYIK